MHGLLYTLFTAVYVICPCIHYFPSSSGLIASELYQQDAGWIQVHNAVDDDTQQHAPGAEPDFGKPLRSPLEAKGRGVLL